jgi:outer membrane protein
VKAWGSGLAESRARRGAETGENITAASPLILGRWCAMGLGVWFFFLLPKLAGEGTGPETIFHPEIFPADVVWEGLEAMQMAIQLARRAILDHEYARGRELLEAVIESDSFVLLPGVDRVAALFALGQTYTVAGRHRDASRAYRRVLAEFPGLVRVRLELARSLFFLGEYSVADYHFRMALAGNLPDVVAANVRYYLRQMQQRRRWASDVTVSFLHNSNVNVAPTIRQIELFGLPFDLDSQSRAKSGFGATVQWQGEYRQPLNEAVRLRLGSHVAHTHYSRSEFNDSIVAAHGGPQLFLRGGIPGDTSVSFLGQGYRRWFGGEPLNRGLGPAVEVTFEPGELWHVAGRLEYFDIRYDSRSEYDGGHTQLTLRPTRVLSATSYGSLTVGAAYDRTDEPRLRNWQYRVGLGYVKEFPLGFTAGFHPEYRYQTYEENWPAFGERRRDHLLQLRVDLLNRRLEWAGFTPLLGYRYHYQDSTIDLYSFRQQRFEAKATRHF